MTTLDLLTQAIKLMKPVSYEYPRKAEGQRIGNPHAIYIFTSKAGEESTKLHIVQTSGASESKEEFPSWRTCNLEEIINVTILEDKDDFDTDPEYKPQSEMYDNFIAKV